MTLHDTNETNETPEGAKSGRLPRGQGALRKRLLDAMAVGFHAPAGEKNPFYRLRDGRSIRKSSATRLAASLDAFWQASQPKFTHAFSGDPEVRVVDTDMEVEAIHVMLKLDPLARARVIAYVGARVAGHVQS